MSAGTAFDLFQATPLANASRDLVIPVLKEIYELDIVSLAVV